MSRAFKLALAGGARALARRRSAWSPGAAASSSELQQQREPQRRPRARPTRSASARSSRIRPSTPTVNGLQGGARRGGLHQRHLRRLQNAEGDMATRLEHRPEVRRRGPRPGPRRRHSHRPRPLVKADHDHADRVHRRHRPRRRRPRAGPRRSDRQRDRRERHAAGAAASSTSIKTVRPGRQDRSAWSTTPASPTRCSSSEAEKEAAAAMGIKVVEATAGNSSEVQAAAQSLVGRVDAISVLTRQHRRLGAREHHQGRRAEQDPADRRRHRQRQARRRRRLRVRLQGPGQAGGLRWRPRSSAARRSRTSRSSTPRTCSCPSTRRPRRRMGVTLPARSHRQGAVTSSEPR